MRKTVGLLSIVLLAGLAESGSVGAFGWGGAYGTTYRVDPEARLVIVLMIQLLPDATDIRQKFPALVYQALVE